ERLENRERLARRLGFDSAGALLAELQTSNERVREIFHHLIAAGAAAPAVNLDLVADPPRATRALSELAHGSVSFHLAPRTRQIFRKLRPLLLEQLAQCADPDATLVAIVRFVEAFGLRSLLFELLATNPKLLELLVRTFDASFFATNVLIRHPHLLEEITRSATLNHSLSLSEHTASLHPLVERGDLDSIRVYRQTQLLRTTMRDVLGLCPLPDLWQEITDLAEACLLAAAAIVGANNLTIIAMGKFGGRELTYASDLDLMFVGDDFRAAQNLITILSIPSAEGVIASVDARLRPEGDKGPLVGSLEAEFLVQALQMRHDVRETSVRLAISKLANIISSEDSALLGCSYEFLRYLETVLRRWRNTSASSLPPDPIEQRKLAIRMGFKGHEHWQEGYERARGEIHAIYVKHFGG